MRAKSANAKADRIWRMAMAAEAEANRLYALSDSVREEALNLEDELLDD